MKTLRSASGPFHERPYFTDGEIDRLAIDELQRVGLLPASPGPVRIDRFIEKRFNLTPTYEKLPEGILGVTIFGKNGVQAIKVSRSLSEEGTIVADFRLSTTLAHEAGHGLLHSHLFALGDMHPYLFNDPDVNSQKILCRESAQPTRQSNRGYDGRWWEFQANQCMSALLLPRPLVMECITPFLKTEGIMGIAMLPLDRRGQAEGKIAEIFAVNPVVARIRVAGMFPEGSNKQMAL